MGTITVQSNATVTPSVSPNPVIFQYMNPEIILQNLVSEYLAKVGFDSLYPNFKGVRVGAEHPFVMFLYNESQGWDLDFNILPSVTITDSQEDETLDTLAIGYEPQKVDLTYVSSLVASLFNPSDNSGYLVTSNTNITNLQNAVNAGQILSGTKRWMTTRHSIDFNIWAENKNVTAVLFDLINTFVLDYIDEMHTIGVDFIGLTGRRSGDFNTDFGRLLYGANVTFNAFIRVGVVEVDLNTVNLVNINVNPTFMYAK